MSLSAVRGYMLRLVGLLVMSWLVAVTDRAYAEQAPELAAGVGLEEVLAAVREHHPEILASRAYVQGAAADALSARGAFDPLLKAEARLGVAGYYDPRRVDVVLEQATPLWGASLYAGYRRGRGDIAPYYGEQKTLAGGELRAGVRLPLLSGRATDERRAALAVARTGQRAADAVLAANLLELEREAASKYLSWLAAGARLRVYDHLLALATQRDVQVRSKVELGALPSLERVDQERAIVERKRQRVAALRGLERAAIELSLYLRDARGEPRVPGRDAVPARLARSTLALAADAALESLALARRPELGMMRAETEALQTQRDLSRQSVLPRLDALAGVSRDLRAGDSALDPTLMPTTIEVGATLAVPLGLRTARGKLAASEQKLAMQSEKLRLTRDKIVSEVRDAQSQLRAAEERLLLAERTFALAEELAAGERERFGLGATTLLFVNVREQASADAELGMIEAWLDHELAFVRLLTATGASPDALAHK